MWQPKKSGPYIYHSTVYILLLVLLDQEKYSEKSENIIGLDSYILNIFSHLEPIWIYISHCMTSLLKLEILWFSGFYCQFIQGVCGTVSSMLSGLETRSLELNTLGTT